MVTSTGIVTVAAFEATKENTYMLGAGARDCPTLVRNGVEVKVIASGRNMIDSFSLRTLSHDARIYDTVCSYMDTIRVDECGVSVVVRDSRVFHARAVD